MKRTGVKWFMAGLISVVGATGLVACETFEPIARPLLETEENLYISINPDSAESWVLGKLYETVIQRHSRITVLQLDDNFAENPFGGLDDGLTDLIIGCTGSLLEFVDPVQAEALEAEYLNAQETSETDSNSGEWRDRTYAALIGSLPPHLAASDPSNATGCADHNELPQHIVPIYRKPTFPREDRQVLNWVSGSLSTTELDDLVRVVRAEGETNKVVEDYVASKGG